MTPRRNARNARAAQRCEVDAGMRGAVQYGSFSCLAKHISQRPYRACNNPPFHPSSFSSFFASWSTLTPVSHLFNTTPQESTLSGDKDQRIKYPDPIACICSSRRTCQWERACSHANKMRHRRREEDGNKSVASCLTDLDLRSGGGAGYRHRSAQQGLSSLSPHAQQHRGVTTTHPSQILI
jgi:hypothetical protein